MNRLTVFIKTSFILLVLVIYTYIYSNSIYIYGEDGTWINNFIIGDFTGGLMPRGSFLVLGVTIQQFIAHKFASSYQAYALIKTCLSLVTIFLVACSFFFNGYLKRIHQYILFASLAIPITLDIQSEAFGHLHNLVWYYPILIFNLSFTIFGLLSDSKQQQRSLIGLYPCIVILGVSGTLFPLCTIVNILFSLSILVYLNIKSKYWKDREIIYLRFCSLLSLSLNVIILINTNDRSASIISTSSKMVSQHKMKIIEYLTRQVLGIFMYLPSYSVNSLYEASIKFIALIIILCIYFNLAFRCSKAILLRDFNPNTWEKLIPLIYASIVPFAFLAIMYFERFDELSYFLDEFRGNGYPNRYYISSIYLFSTSTCILVSSNILFRKREKLLHENYFTLANLIPLAILLLSLSVVVNQVIMAKKEIVNNGFIYEPQYLDENIVCYENYLTIDAHPNNFKTIIDSEHKWYNSLRSECLPE